MAGSWSLSRRLVLGATLWSLILLVVTGSVLTIINRSQTLQLLHNELNSSLITLTRATEVAEDGDVTLFRGLAPSDERYQRPLSGRYWIVALLDEAGEVSSFTTSSSVWDWDIPWADMPLEAAIAHPGEARFANVTGPDNEPVRLAAKAISLPDLDDPVILMAGLDRRPADRLSRNFLITLGVAMTMLALGLMAAMIILIRYGLQPLSRIEQDVADIRAGEKDRLNEDYPQEIAPLAIELNKLLEHNRNVVERARTHVGNLAHALKTPIAVLMNEAQRGDDELSKLVRRQTDSMSQNVQHYLKRAQAAARAEILGARTEVAPAIDDLSRLLQRLNSENGLTVAPGHVDESIWFRGERQDLDEMLGNLLENACKFAESRVRVSAQRSDDGELEIHVDDDGPGLSPEQREQALKRGVRLDETAPGTGLGLSIVKDLAELYSGRFALNDSPYGGLRATLHLPLAQIRE